MAKSLAGALIALTIAFISDPVQGAEPWRANIATDALTDKSIKEACAAEDEFRLCFSFNDEGVWATVIALGSTSFDTELFPAFRVDQNPAVESVSPATLSLERTLRSRLIPRQWEPRHISWRSQVPSKSGRWTEAPPYLIGQMISGQKMLVRIYLAGGYQRDVIFPLQGFCAAAAAVYAPNAPALGCD